MADDGDFFEDETEALLTRTIQKLVGKANDSIECEVLLAFKQDMKGMSDRSSIILKLDQV